MKSQEAHSETIGRKSRDMRFFKVCEIEYRGVVNVRDGQRRVRGEGEGEDVWTDNEQQVVHL